jgi:hypothetical protein
MGDICQAIKKIEHFNRHNDLKKVISEYEKVLPKENVSNLSEMLESGLIDRSLFTAACEVKPVVGQINTMIHASGMLVSLPHILRKDEEIEYISLGAGNTGKRFDLKTSKRVAEFKFITWRGGPESIRQNALFKDFFNLVEYGENLEKYLYVLGDDEPRKFFKSERSIKSILSKNQSLREDFQKRYGERHYSEIKD